MWIFPAGPQTDVNGRVLLLDSDGHYAIALGTGNDVVCIGGGGSIASSANAVLDATWTHVACVYDQVRGWTLYINGTVVQLGATPNVPLPSGADRPFELSSDAPFVMEEGQYSGALDNVILWNVARSQAELCATAGLSCN